MSIVYSIDCDPSVVSFESLYGMGLIYIEIKALRPCPSPLFVPPLAACSIHSTIQSFLQVMSILIIKLFPDHPAAVASPLPLPALMSDDKGHNAAP